MPGALPVVLTHGWPSSFLELTELAGRLAAPSRYGGKIADAFTVIVPALPGFPFSAQRPDLPPGTPTHELWHRLMHDELGFSRYGAHGGDLSRSFSDDFILTQASLYWFANAISPSFRPYWEHAQGMVPPVTSVAVPTAVAVFPKDLSHPPLSWAERTYNVTRYTAMPRGGHFAAREEPALLAADITEFFRPLRQSDSSR